MENALPISPEESELIERYLFHELSAEDESAFELKLSSDKELQQKVREMRLLITGINEAMLETKLEDFHKVADVIEMKSSISTKTTVYRKWLVAASVAVLAIAGIFYFTGRGSSNDQIYKNYYAADPGLITAMSSAEENYSFQKAMVDYKSGSNRIAIKAWEQLLISAPSNDTLNYFLGSAWLKEKEIAKAIPYLKSVSENKRSVFVNEAQWYLGLAYIKSGLLEEAKSLIRNSGHTGAEELLHELEKSKAR